MSYERWVGRSDRQKCCSWNWRVLYLQQKTSSLYRVANGWNGGWIVFEISQWMCLNKWLPEDFKRSKYSACLHTLFECPYLKLWEAITLNLKSLPTWRSVIGIVTGFPQISSFWNWHSLWQSWSLRNSSFLSHFTLLPYVDWFVELFN